ncbi:MAG: chorismate synthase [Flavobacteriales bacterium]|nr:MAG: chorismate synthase [Flavobacteriales bacterium]
MPGNTFGQIFRLTTFGESHGAAIGGVLDGCPAGLPVDMAAVQLELDRRRPGSTPLGTARNEADQVEFLSGLFDGRTLGTPIGFLIRNADARSSDYDALKDVYRPGHADKTWEEKYGLRDHRGGGRSSARTTAACVVGGAIARQLLVREGVIVQAYVSQVGNVIMDKRPADPSATWQSDVRCPEPVASGLMAKVIEMVRAEGDSIGGVVSCVVRGLPVGLGEPVFDKLDADLAKAMLSINATKGFQIGNGFRAAAMRGSTHNQQSQGGLAGGISDGDELHFDVAFKPPATISKAQAAVNSAGEAVTLEAKGRHDPCVVPRAVPLVEAMTCLVLADHLLRQRAARV